MRISDWSSDVCSSDLVAIGLELGRLVLGVGLDRRAVTDVQSVAGARDHGVDDAVGVLGDLARRGGSFDGEADPIWHFAGSPVAAERADPVRRHICSSSFGGWLRFRGVRKSVV